MPPLNLLLKLQAIQQGSEHRHLGVIIEDQLKGQAHINCVTNTIANNVYLLSRLRHFSNVESCSTFFHAHIMCRINYASNVWDSCSNVHIKKLLSLLNMQLKFFARFYKCYLGEGTLPLTSLSLSFFTNAVSNCFNILYAFMFLISSIVKSCMNSSLSQPQIFQSACVLISLPLKNKVSSIQKSLTVSSPRLLLNVLFSRLSFTMKKGMHRPTLHRQRLLAHRPFHSATVGYVTDAKRWGRPEVDDWSAALTNRPFAPIGPEPKASHFQDCAR